MQFLLDGIRKIVVLVLLMELVIQMQPGKNYEPYIKMLVGIMVVYSIAAGISDVFSGITSFHMKPMQEFVWNSDWNTAIESDDSNILVDGHGRGNILADVDEIQVEQIVIGEIKIEEIGAMGGTP